MTEPLDLEGYLHQQAERWREVVQRLESMRPFDEPLSRHVLVLQHLLDDCRRYADEAKDEYDAF